MIAEILSMMEIKEEQILEEEILAPTANSTSMGRICQGWELILPKSSKCSLVALGMKVFKASRASKALEAGRSEPAQEVKDSQGLEEPEDSKILAFLDFFN